MFVQLLSKDGSLGVIFTWRNVGKKRKGKISKKSLKQTSYLSRISRIISVENILSCGEISDFCKEFEQFMAFYQKFMLFLFKICVEKNLCGENLCGEKMINMRSGLM